MTEEDEATTGGWRQAQEGTLFWEKGGGPQGTTGNARKPAWKLSSPTKDRSKKGDRNVSKARESEDGTRGKNLYPYVGGSNTKGYPRRPPSRSLFTKNPPRETTSPRGKKIWKMRPSKKGRGNTKENPGRGIVPQGVAP